MKKIYKYNLLPFLVVALTLILCIPLLGLEKHEQPASKAVAQAVSKPEQQDATDAALKKAGLVNLRELPTTFDVCMRYGTTNNFTGQVLYRSRRAYLRPQTAQKLAAANEEFKKLGYRIKIFDAYRPFSVQKVLYQKVPGGQKLFIANPYSGGSNHNRGSAVDITLERLDGSAVDMPTDFDTFSIRASIYYKGCTQAQKQNRELLASVMVRHGFNRLECEWWHFDDTDAGKYGIVDIPF